MDVKWTIRRFNPSDRPHYLAWRKLVAHRDKNPEFIEWEYYSSPYGPVETWVADVDGKIVGQYSLQRYDCYYFGKLIRASLCFDVATHPDYRNQGMFTKLGFHSLKKEGESNVSFTIGFPWVGGIAIPGHMKVGWSKLGELGIYSKTDLITNEHQDIDAFQIKQITTFDDRFDELAETHKTDLPIMLKRSAAYLNWRYIQKLGYVYHCFEILKGEQLVGYFILKLYVSEKSKTLHIIDYIIPKNPSLYQEVLDFVITYAKNNDVQKVNLVINENHHFFQFLEESNFNREERFFIPIVHRNNDTIDNDLLIDFKNHYLTMGDNDIF
ncbi:MAG: GNAT family N-acetyltransferase [Candidatus Thorarchaeota archaeon]|nr:GNAT family N-acetyltransferase [Candidatus Thorarchaeota archaeon]